MQRCPRLNCKERLFSMDCQWGKSLKFPPRGLQQVTAIAAALTAWLAMSWQAWLPLKLFEVFNHLRQFLKHCIHQVPTIQKSVAMWALSLLHVVALCCFPSPHLESRKWRFRLNKLQIFPSMYKYPFSETQCAVYVKLPFLELKLTPGACLYHQQGLAYVGSTSIGVAKREFNRASKHRQLQENKAVHVELALRYYSSSHHNFADSNIMKLETHTTYENAWTPNQRCWNRKRNFSDTFELSRDAYREIVEQYVPWSSESTSFSSSQDQVRRQPFCHVQKHHLQTPVFQVFTDLDFYGSPVELELVEDNLLLGFYVGVFDRTIIYKLPGICQIRGNVSAGTLRLRLSGLKSRAHLIHNFSFQSCQAQSSLHELARLYVQKGFAWTDIYSTLWPTNNSGDRPSFVWGQPLFLRDFRNL